MYCLGLLALLLVPQIVTPTPCFNSTSLNVYRRPFENITVIIEQADSVEYELEAVEISAENQQIPVLHSGCYRNLPYLRRIQIINSNLNQLEPTSFYNLPKLQQIKINHNSITEIPNGVFHSLAVIKLSLVGNGIRQIQEHAFYNLTLLQDLDLSNNNLESLTVNMFYKTSNLNRINFSHNRLVYIQDYLLESIFSPHPDTQNSLIDFTVNNLTEISGNMFEGVRYVKKVSLSDNSLKSVNSRAFSSIKGGKVLDLTRNPLKCVPDRVWFGPFSIIKLDSDDMEYDYE